MLDKAKKFQHEIVKQKIKIKKILSYESLTVEEEKNLLVFLESFSKNIENILLVSTSIDKVTLERFNNILSASNIENVVSELLYITEGEYWYATENEVIWKKLILAMNRVDNGILTIIQKYESIQNSDDEIFKPSNINKEAILEYLDQALIDIDKATIQKEEKQKLIIYIKETRTEVVKESTSWKKVIGSLVITAAIISGVADADAAYKNINKVITHILGSSIQKTIPSVFKNLNIETPKKQISSNDDSSAIV